MKSILLLTALVAALWMTANHRWSNWTLPLGYGGDGIQTLTIIQAASEGHMLPWNRTNPRLAAPAGTAWEDFPLFDLALISSIGLVAKFIGVAAASNFALLLSSVTSALGFWFAARWLKASEWVAFCGALLWAFSPYHACRGLGHLWMSFDFIVPLAVAWMLNPLPPHWPIIAMGAYVGQAYPYLAPPFFALLAVTLIICGYGWKMFAATTGAAAVTAAISVWPTIHLWLTRGTNHQGLAREFWQCEAAALRPMELFLPPWTGYVERYEHLQRSFHFEPCSAYLGIIGCVLFFALFWRWLKVDGVLEFRPIAFCFVILALACVDGGMCSLGFAGCSFWRSSNRFSIWILATLLLWAVPYADEWMTKKK